MGRKNLICELTDDLASYFLPMPHLGKHRCRLTGIPPEC